MKPLRAARYLALLLSCLPLLSVAEKSIAENASLRDKPAKSALICTPSPGLPALQGSDKPAFSKAKSDFMASMIARHGFDKAELDCVFNQVQPVDKVIGLVRPSPFGQLKNWKAYRARFIEPVRIKAGAAFWDKFKDALDLAEKQYGVPAEIIVGIIGVETIYGKNTGDFRIVDALATLAFDYPEAPKRTARMAFFGNELEQALLYARDNGLDPLSLRGSYAGAIGWPQFMPGSIRRHGVDFDGDGKVDLRNSPVDAIGSVANFLAAHGWKRGEPMVFPAQVDPSCINRLNPFIGQGLAAKNTLSDLKEACISADSSLPQSMLFGLVDLQNGFRPTEYWLGTNNFFAIAHYNRSYFYAMSVIDLGRAVRIFRSNR